VHGDLGDSWVRRSPALLTLLTETKHDQLASTLDVLWVLYDRVLRLDPS
jgi:hypothetical protein